MLNTTTRYSFIDLLIISIDQAIKTLSHQAENTHRPVPQPHTFASEPLTKTESNLSSQLMRINHAGEISAQALYYGQACVAQNEFTRDLLWQSAKEEGDHLIWCQSRLQELNSHTSYLNPLWYTGSFMIGVIAGLVGDKQSLGFLAETECQVEQHLTAHLEKLPSNDFASQAILEQMRKDEQEHAQKALQEGGVDLPFSIKIAMRFTSKIMTSLSKYI